MEKVTQKRDSRGRFAKPGLNPRQRRERDLRARVTATVRQANGRTQLVFLRADRKSNMWTLIYLAEKLGSGRVVANHVVWPKAA